jgi:alpha-aminoadipic semialdehyde synthase
MGVKEVPSELLIPKKKYIFFSHTHKGQVSNIPLLRAVRDSGITLYDYELIKDSNGKRLVAFGKYAGYSGMINALNGLGDRLLTRGIRTPFVNVPLTQYYQNLKHLKSSIKSIGKAIKSQGIPPLIFTFVGTGNVSQGAQEIFKLLPHEWIENVKDIKEQDLKHDRVYGLIVKPQDYLHKRGNEGLFDYSEYLEKPELYESKFHEWIAPYSSVIINGIYWESKFPRLLTKAQMKEIQENSESRLLSIADISCDLEGSIEFMNKASTIDEPFYYYDAVNDAYSTVDSDGYGSVQIMSIDNLPSQLPEDSSVHFGNQLESLIPALVNHFLYI